jgi:TetR/AcrR family transcriptional regulator, transcriptional repressor for nem operon
MLAHFAIDSFYLIYILVGMVANARNPVQTREKLVTAAVGLILERGYHATGVEAICEAAGVTKGSFFHHFANKDELGLAVIRWWSTMGTALYSEAWEDATVEPLQQLFTMIDIMEGFASRPGQPCVCVIGMMAQEMAATHPEFRASCAEELNVWTQNVAALLGRALELHRPPVAFDPEEVAWFLNSLWQGSMLIAKTREDQGLIIRNLRHIRAYIQSLFPLQNNPNNNTKRR